MNKIIIILLCSVLLFGCGKVAQETTDAEKPYNWQDMTYIPAGYAFITPNTVLVLGNSIAYHPAMPGSGWLNNNGMAASTINADYSHQFASIISANVIVRNCWDSEQTYSTFDFSTLPTADMIIIQLGDNMAGNCLNYNISLSRLIQRYTGSQIVLISTILNNNDKLQPVNDEILKSAKDNNIPFIDVRNIMLDDNNRGFSYHPNDSGMKQIAERIYTNL